MALVGSDMVIVEEEQVSLSQALVFERGKIRVPQDFKEKIVNRLINEALIHRARSLTIIVDAGHGGKDPGAISRTGLYEKIVNLDIAKRLKKILLAKGARVIMTREKDEYITLARRTEIASRSRADIFVSIHANSNSARNINGVEVYAMRDLKAEEIKEVQRKRNRYLMFEHMSIKREDPLTKHIVSDLLNRHKLSESDKLASFIAESLSRDIRARNRGMKKSGFFVLRNNLMPAILVEVGYLSNSKEERLLKKGSYRKEIAESLAQGILSYAIH